MITTNGIKLFTTIELASLADKAEELCGLVKSNYDYYGGWYLYEDKPEPLFDYVPCNEVIDLEFMLKWDKMRKWMQNAYGIPMKMYIGTRGDYEDARQCVIIMPQETFNKVRGIN